jgi:hypothetical protein
VSKTGEFCEGKTITTIHHLEHYLVFEFTDESGLLVGAKQSTLGGPLFLYFDTCTKEVLPLVLETLRVTRNEGEAG